jgi:hypothetical protein
VEPKLAVVATFTILADLVANVGGDRVEIAILVGPDSDAHVFSPTPAAAKTIAGAKVVFVNGLGFEGWMDKLIAASGYKGPLVVASDGVDVLKVKPRAHSHMANPMATTTVKSTRMPGRALPMPAAMSRTSPTRFRPPIQRTRRAIARGRRPMTSSWRNSTRGPVRAWAPSPRRSGGWSSAMTHSAISRAPTA